jgi:small multidrug resistance family-3 protein
MNGDGGDGCDAESFQAQIPMNTALTYAFAALLEIGGCYAFWYWLRLKQPALWGVAGVVSLVGFALLLSRVDAAHAGRAYAAYGGVYIAASLLWMWKVEGAVPDRWDLAGAALCLLGAAVILYAPRASA